MTLLALTLSSAAIVFVFLIDVSLSSVSNQPDKRAVSLGDEASDKETKLITCDRENCDSIVNKCLMTDRCTCDFKADASCAKDCIDCLEEKFGKCCPCIGKCCQICKYQIHLIEKSPKSDRAN